ncbi:MAG: flagellar brake protein, partial [Propionivibrio sp.]
EFFQIGKGQQRFRRLTGASMTESTMANTYSDEDIERCTLREQREILFQLRTLIRQNERVSVSFDEGRQSFLTVLIDISADKSLLYFDIGGSAETNRAFLKAERSVFACVIEGIRIQFSVRQARKTTLADEDVFVVAMPSTLLRLQRRESFRLQLPTVKPYLCRIGRGTANEKALPVYDISVSGIGIQTSEPPGFEAMDRLANCWIDLHDSGMLHVTLEVRYIMVSESRSGKSLHHMGCRFVDLPPPDEMLIQRFMARVETERRALSAG